MIKESKVRARGPFSGLYRPAGEEKLALVHPASLLLPTFLGNPLPSDSPRHQGGPAGDHPRFSLPSCSKHVASEQNPAAVSPWDVQTSLDLVSLVTTAIWLLSRTSVSILL